MRYANCVTSTVEVARVTTNILSHWQSYSHYSLHAHRNQEVQYQPFRLSRCKQCNDKHICFPGWRHLSLRTALAECFERMVCQLLWHKHMFIEVSHCNVSN